ncbi:hypothetical protein ASE63_06420 [Bosea sp. Root381]|uniref:2-hydroxyacid dehydrogenase n=1 Tax=Bosea sp. Root381 TaxID=1736524 RepID=UPI000700C443|nr:glyoxylate/hydroxypyruvate reductase A [Bosea sp. Root381]KRE05940.1 hypothetical protein ASE63_06420 [Bosea sp. Root381]
MSLVIIRKSAPAEIWIQALAERAPELIVHVWPETGPVDEVEYVLSWAADPGVIAGFPNLKAIFSLGAGVDHVLSDATVPSDLPVIRMIDESLTRRMVQYVVHAVLSRHRRVEEMRANQAQGLWKRPAFPDLRVGIMGLGEIGRACAQQCLALGYQVSGWSRRGEPLAGVEVHGGEQGLPMFLSRSDVLVCLLPQTRETAGILSRDTLGQLPKGAYLVNAGRGEHLVDDDLLALIAEGHLSGAMLDAFRKEPLPSDNPFWTAPGVTVTPHIAGWTEPSTAARHVVEAIAALRAGQQPRGVVHRARGY